MHSLQSPWPSGFVTLTLESPSLDVQLYLPESAVQGQSSQTRVGPIALEEEGDGWQGD